MTNSKLNMRLALTLVALVVAAGPAVAASSSFKCFARAHKGAIPFEIDETNGVRRPADTSQGSSDPTRSYIEVAGIEADYHGQEWVIRVHEFAWKRKDVDLRGNCNHAQSDQE